MAKNKTVIKKPSGNGNISITIENNLKNTNTSPAPKKRRRRQKAKNDESVENSQPRPSVIGGGGPSVIGGGGGGLDVSYIKPPVGSYSIWRDTFDSYNTTIPSGQAQSLGLTRPTISDNNSEISSNIGFMKKQLDELTQKSITPTFQKYGFDDYDDEVLSRADTTMFDDNILQEAVALLEGVPEEQQKEITDNMKAITTITLAKRAGTYQGLRGVKPSGEYMNNPEFKEAFKIGLNTRKNTPIDNRKNYALKTIKKNNLQIIAEDEDLEAGTNISRSPPPPPPPIDDASKPASRGPPPPPPPPTKRGSPPKTKPGQVSFDDVLNELKATMEKKKKKK